MRLDAPVVPASDLFYLIRIGMNHFISSTHGNRFEVFGSHHRPHAGTAVEMFHLIADICKKNQLLPCRSDGCHPDSFIFQFFTNSFHGYPVVLSPDVPGITDLHFSVMNPEINRLGSTAADHNRVIPCKFELGGPVPARFCFPECTGQRGPGSHRIAAES